MWFRTLARIVLSAGLLVAHVRSARAEAVETRPALEPTKPVRTTADAPSALDVSGFDILLAFSYGVPTTSVFGLEVDPYAATFGLETGYTFRRGFRLGAYFHYGLGRAHTQTYTPRRSAPFDINTDASNLVTGLSLGYDLPLHFLVLRYTLNLGLSWMSWDFDSLRENSAGEYTSDTGSPLGFHLAPGLSLLWPIRLFEWGIGFDYVIQVEDRIPPGILTKLLIGVKL